MTKNGVIAKEILDRNDDKTDLSLDARSTTAFRSSSSKVCDFKYIIRTLRVVDKGTLVEKQIFIPDLILTAFLDANRPELGVHF